MPDDKDTTEIEDELSTLEGGGNTLNVDRGDPFQIAQRVEDLKGLAKSLVNSGLLPDKIKKPGQAIVIMLTGYELGIPMMQSFTAVDVIKGNPTTKPKTMIALAERSGELEDWGLERDEDMSVRCWVKRHGRTEQESVWSLDRAEKMKTKQKGKTIPLTQKFNWRTMPMTMLEWRAIGDAFRKVFPDVIGGLYIPDEMETKVREADYTVDEGTEELNRAIQEASDKPKEGTFSESDGEDEEETEVEDDPDPEEQPLDDVNATDAALDLMVNHDIPESEVHGTGKDGRVTKSDVEDYIEAREEEEGNELFDG